MASLVVMIAVSLAASTCPAEAVPERIQKHFKSDDYTVTWDAAPRYDPDADLEVGDGEGHAGVIGWLRFQPRPGWVDVLSIEFDEGLAPYDSKWPPDRGQATVRQARMNRDAYASLLGDLSIVSAAEVRLIRRDGWPLKFWVGSNNSWAYARLAVKKKTVLRLDWAGCFSDLSAAKSAKPLAAVALAHDAVEGLDFKAHVLTDKDRAWASAKFARAWREFECCESHWWVRDTHIQLVGFVGDETALPTLRRILEAPPKAPFGGEADDHCVYNAINAVTRITRKDLRDKPTENMDLEATRQKVLDHLRNKFSRQTTSKKK